ncbi:ABC transporter substrate-binding protein [Streptomyces blattellae]|uniref:ABC transporter substrate-binding protein n=1 Tax=Streptomyces blattellae TaxID=2569855 RepID=UPI0012BA03E8|nr:ABC transporter substrate-binding protein [Streptomyces blattellae]
MLTRHRRTTRSLIAAGASVAALATATACSDTGASAKGANGPLVFGISADATQLLPWTATAVQSQQVLGQVYSSLLNQDSHLAPVAGLADLPAVSKDGLTYTFALKSGLTFTDGSTLDSTDVKYSIDKILDPDTNAVARTSLSAVKSVSAPDARHVVIELRTPDASLVSALTVVNTAILPSGKPLDSLKTKPVGSGPYAFESRTPNQSITLVRNAGYYRGRPGLSSLEFRVIQDENSMVSALRSGTIDMAVFDDYVTARTAKSADVTTHTVDQLDYHALQLRPDSSVFKDTDVRLAVQCAIDREQVVKTAALGQGDVAGPITSPAYASDPDARPCPTRDVNAAKKYLADAGKPGGFTFTAIVPQGLYSSAADEAQNIQAQLAGAGITMKIETLDSSAYVDRWLAGDFDAAVALNGAGPDPATTYTRYFTSDGNFNKVAGYRSANLDKLFAEGIATTDTAARKAAYQKISRELEDKAVWIWLYTGRSYIATNTRVQGFQPITDASLQSLWETKLV